MTKRRYTLKQRAQSQERTRGQIVEAAMRLHEELGPRATTISAIAREAGVQRLTVYRHFPDETAIFEACTSHWLVQNPPPDPQGWSAENDGMKRVRRAIGELYAYYGRTRRMWTVSFRDVEAVPALQAPMAAFGAYLRDLADDLARGVAPGRGADPVAQTLRHAVHFLTWKELEEQGVADPAKLDLILDWLEGVRHAKRKKSGSA